MSAFQVGLVVANHPHTRGHLNTLRLLDDVAGIHLCVLPVATELGGTAGSASSAGEELSALAAAAGGKAQSTTTDLDALLGRPGLVALVVAVPNVMGPDVLRRAIAAGKPVLFEKPGATSAADLREVARAASVRGLTLGTMLPWRYHPISRQIREAIQAGALGRVMAVEARMITSQVRYRDPHHWLFGRESAGSGILSWLGIHWLDLLGFLLGQRVTTVAALVGNQNPEPIAVEDTACLALRYADGTMGTLQAGYLLPGSQSGYSAAAYDNYLALRGYDGWVTWPHTATPGYTLFSTVPGWDTAGKQERRFELPPSDAYAGAYGVEFVRDFLYAAQVGRPAPCPIEDAVHAVEVVEAALEAARLGRTVSLP